jgi:hypothetical protein
MEKQDIRKELKALGVELAVALKQIRSSREFHHLEEEVVTGIKNISASLVASVKAARKSRQTNKIAHQFRRVVAAGSVQGKAEAARAQKAAVVGLRKVRSAVADLTKRVRKART